MAHVTITLPDGSRRSVPAGTTVRTLMADLPPRVAKSAVAAIVNDEVVDLSFSLDADASLRDGILTLRIDLRPRPPESE